MDFLGFQNCIFNIMQEIIINDKLEDYNNHKIIWKALS